MLFSTQQMLKIGHSVDYHNLVGMKNCQQKLGGIEFNTNYKIVAHSDGDIILHTISEAILGALGQGDLGQWFSDNDPKNKNIDSLEILKFCLDKCQDANYGVLNVDLTIICDAINFKDKKQQIQDYLQKILNCSVNIKATRYETNCSTRIKCHCVCLLMHKYIVNCD